tara:strand:- start:713 stop:964 length:252 start_codon:yes stop_codon:yes gene_type:complete
LILKATLVGACQRIFETGCNFDYVCVLKGQQGIRKSTFFKLLAGGHFNSTMPSGVDKDCLMLIGTTNTENFLLDDTGSRRFLL